MALFGAAAAANNLNKSIEVVSPPDDGVSSLNFSPKYNLLAATSWDKQVRVWEVQPNGQSVPKAAISHDKAVLCSAWKDDGATIFSGGCDRQVKMWALGGGQPVTVAMHDAPVKSVAWIPEMNLLATASWDKSIRYWDTRQQNPAHTQVLPERVYSMDVRHPVMVVATAERHIIVFNLSQPQVEYKRVFSPLKLQTRVVTLFPNKEGYLVGSIEGRVGVNHIEEDKQVRNFTFKCHREGQEIHTVNDIKFHPVYGTFFTAGSDGLVTFWDKDAKQRIKSLTKCNQPISSAGFNNEGKLLAYSASYDWSKGIAHHSRNNKNVIFIHSVQDEDVKAKPKISSTPKR